VEVVGTIVPVTPDEVGRGTQRHSVTLVGAVAPIAHRERGYGQAIVLKDLLHGIGQVIAR